MITDEIYDVDVSKWDLNDLATGKIVGYQLHDKCNAEMQKRRIQAENDLIIRQIHDFSPEGSFLPVPAKTSNRKMIASKQETKKEDSEANVSRLLVYSDDGKYSHTESCGRGRPMKGSLKTSSGYWIAPIAKKNRKNTPNVVEKNGAYYLVDHNNNEVAITGLPQ